MRHVSGSQLAVVEREMERGRFLQAYEKCRPLGRLGEWQGCPARICAGRLAFHLGAVRLCHVIFWRAFKAYPDSLAAYLYELDRIIMLYGPVASWRFLTERRAPDSSDDEERVLHLARKSYVYGRLRDFESAELFLGRAADINPHDRQVLAQRSALLELQDRYAEALAACRRLVEAHPAFISGLLQLTHLLQLLDRLPQALSFLRGKAENLESYLLWSRIISILVEMKRPEEALALLPQVQRLSPLRDRSLERWLRGLELHLNYCCGRFEQALALAASLEDRDRPEFVERLSGARELKRVRLEVQFIRQHHLTCAPATLAALTRYWGRPIAHLHIVEDICYDGTPSYKIRPWAAEHGWTVREFTLTWESARALIDRQVPFGITTVEPGSAHFQAIVGYDEITRAFLIRDPFIYFTIEAPADKFLKRYRGSGPKALILLPQDRTEVLEGIELPDCRGYDLLFVIQESLARYDHARAWQTFQELGKAHPRDHLTSAAALSLASYDGSTTSMLKALERHLESYPEDGPAQLLLLNCYTELGRLEERSSRLKELCLSRPEPVFFRERARDFSYNNLQRAEALYWIKKALNNQFPDAEALKLYADLLWNGRQFEPAQQLYRLAVTLDDKRETYIPDYFTALRHFKKSGEVISLLEERVRRYRSRSSSPAISLITTYRNMDLTEEAFRTLEAEIRSSGDDGKLLSYAAEMYASYGRFEQARSCLERSRGRVPKVLWNRTAALIAQYRGEKKESLKRWQKVLEIAPLHVEALANMATLISETENRRSALSFLKRTCARFPHHVLLHRLWIDWLGGEEDEQVESICRRLLDFHPYETGLQRELAVSLLNRRRFEEAERQIRKALDIEPHNPENYTILGNIYAAWRKKQQAREAYEQALILAIDTPPAITGLAGLCSTIEEKKALLKFVEGQLIRQTVFGAGLLAFYDLAKRIAEPEALLRSLEFAHSERPDLWHTWTVLIRHLLSMGNLLDAGQYASQAAARFPLHPGAWMDLALIQQIGGDRDKEIEALKRAHEISPSLSAASQRLCALYKAAGDLKEAEALIASACAQAPLDPSNHGLHAELLYESNRKEEALTELKQALNLDPGYEWAWDTFLGWSREGGDTEAPVLFIRRLIRNRGGDARLRLLLAQGYLNLGEQEKGLRVLRKALELDPQLVAAYDLMAENLARRGSFQRALACCRPEELAEVPLRLRIREVWIHQQQGDHQGAVRELRQILEHNPESYECWQLLVEGLWEQGLYPDLEQTARQMSALFSFHPVPLGYLGAALLKSEKEEPARQAFEKSFNLDRSYIFAGLMLFDLELKRNEVEKARQILESLIRQIGDSDIAIGARKAHLAVKEQDRARACALLTGLCLVYFDDDWPVESTVRIMEEAGWRDEVWSSISRAINQPQVNPCAARIWARYSTSYNLRSALSRIDTLEHWNRSGAYVVTVFTDEVCRAFQSLICQPYRHSFYEYRSILRRLFRRYYRVIKLYPETWTLMLRALLFGGHLELARSRLDDWQDYSKTTPQRLAAVVAANYLCGRPGKARQALTYARNRIARGGYSNEPVESYRGLFALLDRVLSCGYGPFPADVLAPAEPEAAAGAEVSGSAEEPEAAAEPGAAAGAEAPGAPAEHEAPDPLIPFFQRCLLFLDLLRRLEGEGRRPDQGAVALFQRSHPEAWHMKRLLGYLLKRFRKKAYGAAGRQPRSRGRSTGNRDSSPGAVHGTETARRDPNAGG